MAILEVNTCVLITLESWVEFECKVTESSKWTIQFTYVIKRSKTFLKKCSFTFQNETTPLHVACMDNHQAQDSALLCDLLIKAGAKVDAIDVDGHTPLHFCCLYGLSDSAKILVGITLN